MYVCIHVYVCMYIYMYTHLIIIIIIITIISASHPAGVRGPGPSASGEPPAETLEFDLPPACSITITIIIAIIYY